ncbi:MAG: regulatory protein RecX [Pseudomarimonas sp.]
MAARTPGKDCWQRALAALNRREHSQLELTRKLKASGFEEEMIAPVLEQLIERGWLSDGRYAGALARTRASSGQGPLRIQVELARQGISADQAETALATCEGDWAAQARALVIRRFGESDLRGGPNERKAVDFLLRRGFDLSVARASLRDDVD